MSAWAEMYVSYILSTWQLHINFERYDYFSYLLPAVENAESFSVMDHISCITSPNLLEGPGTGEHYLCYFLNKISYGRVQYQHLVHSNVVRSDNKWFVGHVCWFWVLPVTANFRNELKFRHHHCSSTVSKWYRLVLSTLRNHFLYSPNFNGTWWDSKYLYFSYSLQDLSA